jgi:L-iditol 2-dehydrogenase
MKAAFLLAPGKLELRDIPEPVPGPGEVVVGIRVALTDGTDLKAFRRGHPKMPMPTRFGHEFAGDVRSVGAGVTKFKAGDRVVSVHSAPCGTCYWCRREEQELCATIMDRLLLGAYGEALCVPAEIVQQNMYRMPDDLEYDRAAFLEPLSCVMHAWEPLPVHDEMTVVVHGVGGFGILHALVAQALGVPNIFLIGRSSKALARAKKLQIGTVIDATTTDVRTAIFAATEQRGADIVVECTGAQEVWESAPALARRGGTVILFGGLPSETRVQFDATRLHYDEVQLYSPFHLTPRAVQTAFRLLCERKVDPLSLLTSSFALANITEAFVALDSGSDVKIAIRPGAEL